MIKKSQSVNAREEIFFSFFTWKIAAKGDLNKKKSVVLEQIKIDLMAIATTF